MYAITEFMNSEDKSRHYQEFKNYTGQIDRIRGTNFKKTFPELWALL